MFAFAGASVVMGLNVLAGTGANGVTMALFWVLFPLANAALDMISWGGTRTLLSKIDHDSDGVRGFTLVFGALVVDIVVAMLCLVGLAA